MKDESRIMRIDTTVGFLTNRRRAISLSSSDDHPSTYIWRRIFLRAKRSRS